MSASVTQRVTDKFAEVLKQELAQEGGASAAEYALILAIVGAAIAGAMVLLGGNITTAINNAAGQIK